MSDSKTINKGFEMYLEVIKIGSIKPMASGTFTDRDGRQLKYNGSVSFKVLNTEVVDDDILGQKEVDTVLILKISCDEDKEIKALNEYIRVLKEGKYKFKIPITIPRQVDGSTFKATCTLNSKEFITMMEKELKKIK